MSPRLLILDEAFSRIASADIPVIAAGLKEWSGESGCSVVLLERDGEPFKGFCDQNGFLEGGSLVLDAGDHVRPRLDGAVQGGVSGGRSLLEFRDLGFSWRPEEPSVFDSIDGVVREGERIALVGPNGAGKSTLMRLCSGLISPDSGSIELDGIDVGSMDPELRASRVGFLFQDAERQIFHSTVEEEVLFSLRKEDLSRSEKEARLERALADTGLSGMEKKHPLDLNSAERRMVAVASLAVKDLDMLLLDEPTRDFDSRWMRIFENWLERQRGAVLAVSHDPDFVSRFFPTVWILKNGILTSRRIEMS
jgi:energy-coupling factor transport system ATP-binding protein